MCSYSLHHGVLFVFTTYFPRLVEIVIGLHNMRFGVVRLIVKCLLDGLCNMRFLIGLDKP